MRNSRFKKVFLSNRSLTRNLVLILFSILAIACNFKEMELKQPKVMWSATLSAPVDYPVEIVEGALLSSDYEFYFDPIWGTINSGWGVKAGFFGGSETENFAPQKMSFTWYSYIDQTFYSGSWNLDPKLINEYFSKKYTWLNVLNNKYSEEGYYYFMIGFAPNGMLNIWICGDNDQRILGIFQGEKVERKIEDLRDDAKYMVSPNFIEIVMKEDFQNNPDTQKYLEDYGPTSQTRITEWNTAFNWKIELKTEGDLGIVNPVVGRLKLINGEYIADVNSSIMKFETEKLAAPDFLQINWNDVNDVKKIFIMNFNKQKVWEALNILGNNNKEVVIKIQINAEQTKGKVIVEAGNESIEVEMMNTKLAHL